MAQRLLAPGGLRIVNGCNPLREPLLLTKRRVETYDDTNKRRCRYPGDSHPSNTADPSVDDASGAHIAAITGMETTVFSPTLSGQLTATVIRFLLAR